jgi:DNA-binding CsgD family transcriptional regulator
MAEVMRRARPTIERHVRILHRKFGARSRAHLVALALTNGCITLDRSDDLAEAK